MINNIPLAIILRRTQNGYTFQSLQEVGSSKDNNKKPKLGRKPAFKGVPNRLIKEIGLSNQQLVLQVTPQQQPHPFQQIQEQPRQNQPVFQVVEEEEVSCEVERDTELPKSPANWFDKQKINEIQKRELKWFFTESDDRKSELYIKYRNFIVQSYQKNPKRYLTKISCRRILRGDANTIMRIHSFLENHCIINFAVGRDGNYSFKSSSLSKQYEQKGKPQSCLKNLAQNDEQNIERDVDTDNMTITVINKNFSRTYRACCSQCKLICGIVWFANIREEQTSQKSLCYECFSKLDLQQALQYAKVDIVKKIEAHGRDGKSFPKNAWNIEENVKLLDFMANSKGQSWRKLLNFFDGKRTIQDIVLQFLQFPISNLQVGKSKIELQRQRKKQSNSAKIGFNAQDYKNILQEFYENSEYSKKGKEQKKQNEEIKMAKRQQDQANQLSQGREFQGADNVLNLTMEKILAKIQKLRQHEHLVHAQTARYESLVLYSNKHLKAVETQQQEQLPKPLQQLQHKSRSFKNQQQRRLNQGTQQVLVEGQNGVSQRGDA